MLKSRKSGVWRQKKDLVFDSSLLTLDSLGKHMSIVETFQDIARQELARQRHRLGQLTLEQERAVESLLMSTINKISRPLVQQIERSFETVEAELVNMWRPLPATLKEGQSGVRQIIEPVLDES